MTNNKIRVTNHFKQTRCTKKRCEIERLKNILLSIASEKQQQIIYRKKVMK